MKVAYIIDAARSPIGKYGGALSSVRPDDLLAEVIRGILKRNKNMPASAIEDVIAGAANQAGEDNRNVARMSALLAGLPVTVAGATVNRLCASGLQAIMDASRSISCGDGDIYLAGGVESMSRAPLVMSKANTGFDRNQQLFDTTIGWRFPNERLSAAYHPYSMGETAENVARRWKISREEQDAFALASQQKYFRARDEKKWPDEIVPITLHPQKGEPVVFSDDEHPRVTSAEKLASLKPAFVEGGTVTAGNSSGINDGASMLIVANETAIQNFDLKPMAKVRAMAVAGVDPAIMGIGPVEATRKAVARAGISIDDLGLIELNEAFASQSIACIKELNLDPEIVNVNGGAIALGHPLGCSGARISTTLLHEMVRSKTRFGLATMCVGVGQGAAVVYELC